MAMMNESDETSVAARLNGLQLYRVDWDIDAEMEVDGEMVAGLQHAYTFVAVPEGGIGRYSKQWDQDNIYNLTVRFIGRTVEEDAYRAGLQDGFNIAMQSLQEENSNSVPGPDQPTLFDEE